MWVRGCLHLNFITTWISMLCGTRGAEGRSLFAPNLTGATQKAGVMKIPILLQRLVCLFTEDVLSTTTADTQKTWTFNIPTKRPTPSIHLGFSTWRDSSIPPGRCGKLW